MFQAEKRRCGEAGVRGLAGLRKAPPPRKGCGTRAVIALCQQGSRTPGRQTKRLCVRHSRPGLTGPEPRVPAVQRCQADTSAHSCVALGK